MFLFFVINEVPFQKKKRFQLPIYFLFVPCVIIPKNFEGPAPGFLKIIFLTALLKIIFSIICFTTK